MHDNDKSVFATQDSFTLSGILSLRTGGICLIAYYMAGLLSLPFWQEYGVSLIFWLIILLKFEKRHRQAASDAFSLY